ncbi:unnamed protein product, partial [Ilex paraguariensis]
MSSLFDQLVTNRSCFHENGGRNNGHASSVSSGLISVTSKNLKLDISQYNDKEEPTIFVCPTKQFFDLQYTASDYKTPSNVCHVRYKLFKEDNELLTLVFANKKQ